MENQLKNKSQPKIYEDQTKLEDFIEPEWIRKYKLLVLEKQISQKPFMVKNG